MSSPKAGSTLSVWLFDVDNCKGDEVLEAGLLLKRLGDDARGQVQAYVSTLTDPSQKEQWSLILKRLNALLAPDSQAAAGAAGAGAASK